ncbi:T9SS type A sorting domain-containing protein [Aureispira anguillae]|uniref:T9SS type A sorting domain-containing protein n=1 Tax=Aureispira anguillae TaxID=2864201 RepID=A0A915YJ92_9BACT|nr:T9SS type A sorting domain-containing protein [Aureispira anguillae]BDS14029.1 T9SS type A sorting domain-containing protein [Aureispira anguillae]
MKFIFSMFFSILAIGNAIGQIWETEITPNIVILPPANYEQELKGYDIRETNDGNYVFAGNYKYGIVSNLAHSPVLAKLDATTGNVIWLKEYPTFNGGYLQEVSLVEKPNGNLLLAGINYNRIFLIETDANGDTISTHQFASTCETVNNVGCNLRSVRLRATNDGNYIIGIGSTGGLIGLPSPINQLIKISPNNSIIWNKNYTNRFLLDVQPTNDGGYIFSGSTAMSQPILFKVDMNGDSLWQQTYSNMPIYDLHSVKETPDNGFVVACHATGFAGNSPFLLKMDQTGTVSWQLPLGGQLGVARHVVVDPDGNYVVTGTNRVTHGGGFAVMLDAAFVTRVTAAGSILQHQIFDDMIDNSSRAVRYTTDGNFVLAGSHGASLGDQERGYVVKTGYYLNTLDINEENTGIEVFPNPFKHQTTLRVNGGVYTALKVQVFDALGRQVQQAFSTNGTEVILPRKDLERGIYFFKLRDGQQIIGTGKLTIQ